MTEEFIEKVENEFNLKDQDVGDLNRLVRDILSSDDDEVNFTGVKTFTKTPVIEESQNIDTLRANQIPNVKSVKSMLNDNNASLIKPTSVVDANPGNASGMTVDSDRFMHWHFDNQTRDTADFTWPDGSKHEFETCAKTGNLVVYGWLADNGSVLPQEAWVALYGLIKCGTSDDGYQDNWVALQVQPWIIGSKSTAMQYVSFNIPVTTGLKLRIKTGFGVNTNPSGLQFGSRQTFSLNQPGAFVGYVIHDKLS